MRNTKIQIGNFSILLPGDLDEDYVDESIEPYGENFEVHYTYLCSIGWSDSDDINNDEGVYKMGSFRLWALISEGNIEGIIKVLKSEDPKERLEAVEIYYAKYANLCNQLLLVL